MNDRQTNTQGEGSAFKLGNTQNVHLNVPFSRLPDTAKDVRDYTLIDDQGRIWTNSNDPKFVEQMVQRASQGSYQPAT